MNYFYSFDFRKKRRRRFYIIFFSIAVVLFTIMNYTSLLNRQHEPTVLLKGSEKENNIALTFNISWGENKIVEIIDVLKEHDIQATFFASGEWAERNPDLLTLITDNEHELGMLGYRYQNYVEQKVDDVRRDLHYAQDIFRKLGYEDITLLRTPTGKFNSDIVDLAKNLNYNIVHWTVNTFDWERPGVNEIVNKTLEETGSGDIILMHASDSAEQTADALNEIIPALKNKSFNFVSITSLKNEVNPKTELIE